MRFLLTLLITLFISKVNYGQNLKIKGLVKTEDGQNIVSATIQLKDKETLSILNYAFTDHEGQFELSSSIFNKSTLLVVSCLGFRRDTLVLPERTTTIHHTFVLSTDENQLSEVTVNASKPIIQEINDTTKYNVKAFTSPEDRNLESVIKKMPGMEVSTDGTIFFKKKKISKVLLEDDDLTGDNYKAITQNLNPNLVDEVQAIENWVEDDLLKGIINSDDIVLNLKLKDKRRQKIVGGADIDYGTNNRRDLSTNLITFVDKTKAFGFIRSNNIGSSQENIFQLAGSNRRLTTDSKLIDHRISTYNPFDGETMALNNSLSGSLNAINRFSDSFKLSTSVYSLSNKLYGENSNTNIYYDPINVITRNQQNQSSRNRLYQADVNADYLVAKNARLTAKFTYKFRPQLFSARAFSDYNNSIRDEINQLQNDKLKNYSADLKYTLKASQSEALVLSAKIAQDNLNQAYHAEAGIYGNIPIFDGATDLLQAAFIKSNLAKLDVQALKKINRNYVYINLGAERGTTSIASNLHNSDNNSEITGFSNDDYFSNTKVYLTGKYNYVGGKLSFYTLLKISLVNQQNAREDSTLVIFEPEFGLNKKIGEMQSLRFNYNYKNNLANPINYYSNLILTDVRNVNSGVSKLFNYGSHNLNLAYFNSVLSDKYLTFNANAGFQYNEGSFLTNNFFENTIYYTQLIPFKGTTIVSGGIGAEKFVPFIETKFSLNYNSSATRYYGQVANSINQYTSFNQLLSAKAGTGFKLPINFSFEFQYQNNSTRLLEHRINTQDVYKYAIQSRFNITKKLFNLTDFSWYKMSNQNYRILSLQLQFAPAKGIFKYALYGKNLLNVTSIDNIFVSNVGESRSSVSILGRYILGSVMIAIK